MFQGILIIVFVLYLISNLTVAVLTKTGRIKPDSHPSFKKSVLIDVLVTLVLAYLIYRSSYR